MDSLGKKRALSRPNESKAMHDFKLPQNMYKEIFFAELFMIPNLTSESRKRIVKYSHSCPKPR